MHKNRASHLFLKITFFFALYFFSLPPKHFLIIFSCKFPTKKMQKLPEGEKQFFFLNNLFKIYLSSDR